MDLFIELELDVRVEVDEIIGRADEKYPLVERMLVGRAADIIRFRDVREADSQVGFRDIFGPQRGYHGRGDGTDDGFPRL
jgi:hypothetical protein